MCVRSSETFHQLAARILSALLDGVLHAALLLVNQAMSAFSFGSAPKLPSWASGRSVKTEAPTDAGNPSANDAADGGTGARGPTAEGGVASRAKPGSTTAQGTVVPATLKAGEYTVRVHVLEGQRFVSESGTINALVEVGIDGVGTAGSVQTLPVAKSAVMPVWDQELIFGLECSAKEANNAQISIAVYDVLGPTSLLGFNRLIGRWHVELAHVYAHEGHEIYKDWIALELLEEGIGARGLLKLTVQVLGDGDVPREHAAGDDGVDAATAMHRLAAAVREPWCLVARVHRAHNIVKTDLTGHADPFVELRRGGETVRTSTIKSTPSPVWEQQIELPFVEPTPLQEAQLSLNDHDSLNMLHGNDVIGTQTIELDKLAVGTREPPEDAEPRWVHLYGAQQGVEGEIAAAMNEGRMEGYHYRGSLLVTIWKRRGAGGEQDTRTRSDVLPLAGDLKRQKGKVSVRRGSTPGSSLSAPPGVNRLLAPLRPKSRRLLNVPKHLKRSAAPLTQPPPDAKYELRVWLLKAVEVAVDSNASVEVEIGGHALEFHAKDPSRGMATWREKQRLTAELPSEPAALPDVCVYVRRKLGAFENTAERAAAAMGFDKGEAPRTTERVGCARLPAAALIKACEEHRAAHPEWVPLRWLLLLRDHSIDEIHSELAAYVQIGIELGRVDALAKVAFNDVPQPKMQARLLVGRFYLGRSLPPPQPNPHERLSGLLSLRSADEVDPFAVMHCHGGHVRSSTKQKTRNPRWYEEHSTLVQLPKKDHLAPLILLTVHDYALFGTHNSTVAHAFLNVPDVRVRSLEALDTALPEWVPLSSMNGEPLDEDAGVLMTVALVPMDEAPSPPRPVRIALDAVPVVVELIVFGCRHLRPMGGLGMSMRATYVEADLGDQATRAATRHARKQPANPTFVEVLNIRSKLAKPAILAPRLNLRVRSARPGPLEDALVGVAYIDLGSRLPWVDAGANGAAEAGADADAPPPKLDTRGLIAWLTKLRDLRDRLFGRDAHDEPPSALAGRALETLALGIMPTAPAEGGAGRAGRPPRLASCDGTEQLTASNTKLIVDKKEPKGLGRLQKSIDLTTSVLGEPPRKGKLRKPEPSYSYAVLDGSDGGYVPVPDEIRREYLVGRESFAEPLEAQLPRALFERWDLSALAAPSVFGTSSHTHREKVGVCKGILRVYERDPTAEDEETDETPSESESDAEEGQELDEEQAERAIAAAAVRATRRSRRSAVVRVRRERSMEERRTEMRELATITPLIHRALRAREVVVRVYVLSAQDLLPADSDGLADPYVVVSLGDDKVGSADWREENTREPHFFRCFELTASLPGDSQLMIMIYDWDLLSIGGAQLMGSCARAHRAHRAPPAPRARAPRPPTSRPPRPRAARARAQDDHRHRGPADERRVAAGAQEADRAALAAVRTPPASRPRPGRPGRAARRGAEPGALPRRAPAPRLRPGRRAAATPATTRACTAAPSTCGWTCSTRARRRACRRSTSRRPLPSRLSCG